MATKRTYFDRLVRTVGIALVFVALGCAKAPVDWQWVGGPPGPLTVSTSARHGRVLHGQSIVVTAKGGLGRYQFSVDDGNAGGQLVPEPNSNRATYVAPPSGAAKSVVFTVVSESETATTVVELPATGSLDPGCGGGAGFATFELCGVCSDMAKAVLLRDGTLNLFGSSYHPADTPTPTSRYAVQAVDAATLAPVANRWGQPTGGFRFNPGHSLNVNNAVVGVSAGPGGSVFYGGERSASGMLLGRLDPNGSQESNFDGAGNPSRQITDSRYNPRGIQWSDRLERILVPAAQQVGASTDSVRVDFFRFDGSVPANPPVPTVTFPSLPPAPSLPSPRDVKAPYALALADGGFVTGSASHENGTLGVVRFTSGGAPDTTFDNGNAYRLMTTNVALTPGWSPQAARLVDGTLYLAGAQGNTVWVNAMRIDDGFERRSSLSFSGSNHTVRAVVPQPDGGILVLGFADHDLVRKGFLVRFRISSTPSGLEPDSSAFAGGFPQTTDILPNLLGGDPYAVEAAERDAEGRILAVGWRETEGRRRMLAACLFP
jgi:hypothetical protein